MSCTYNNFTINKPWINSTCKIAKRYVKLNLNLCMEQNFSPESLQEYSLSKKEFKTIVHRQKNLYKNHVAETIANSTNPKEFWNAINSNKKKNTLISHNIRLEDWYRNFKQFYSVASPNSLPLDYASVVIPELDMPFNFDEIMQSIKKCKTGKASGENKISNEFLKNLLTTGYFI